MYDLRLDIVPSVIQSITAPHFGQFTSFTAAAAAADDNLACCVAVTAELTYKLGIAAEVKCSDLIDAYNRCAEGRTISMFACKSAYKASQACIAE